MLPPDDGDRDCEQSRQKVGLDAENQARLQVAPEEVGASRCPEVNGAALISPTLIA